uniref:Reverse transcriptase domain-containing protein n=1 Tax=Oryzias latipes TaxID=8090 RepID=A0A3P9LA26_ORYLA
MMVDKTIRIISYNVNGMLNPIKRSKIFSKLKRERGQVVFLQETHLTEAEHEKLRRGGFKHIFYTSYKSGHRRGSAILISNQVQYEHISETKDKEGRYVMIIGRIEGSLVTLFSIYAPPGSDWQFYKKVFNIMSTESRGILISGGDMNIRLTKMDSSGSSLCHKKPLVNKINSVIKEIDIIDVWRELNSTSRDYTYYSAPQSTYSRIDYFFMFGKDRHRIQSCDIGTIDISDHAPVKMLININDKPKSTTWKLNLSVLNNAKIKEELGKEIEMYFEDNDNGEVSPTTVWDAYKAVLRGKIISLSSSLKKRKQDKLNQLTCQLKDLQKQHKIGAKHDNGTKIKKLQNEIDEIYSEEVKKKLVFLKQGYYEAGSKAMKLLAYKLRKQQKDNTITKIRHSRTEEIQYKPEDIQNCFEEYYKNLYAQPKLDNINEIGTFLESLDLPKVTQEQNKTLVAEITENEVKAAISRLKPQKTPGQDGFPAEWYKCFRAQLTPKLCKICNWVLQKGTIPSSWRDAIISVIPKEGKDKLDCKQYRPISVLNVDYKIFMSILARRIEKILPSLIHLDQTGFIHQRQTHDSLRRTLHIIWNIQQNKTQAMLMGLDAEKAFDTVRWTFLFKVLEKYGLHKILIQALQAVYNNPTARIKINGSLTKPFTLERSCRQGCPCSPLLFALFIEPLSQLIRQAKEITGVKIGGQEHKLSLFADDVLIYLTQPLKSLPILMSSLKEFGQLSGYRLNVQKTQILTLNFNPPKQLLNKYDLICTTNTMKYLGINLTQDITKLFDANYAPLNLKIKSDISRWTHLPFLNLSSRIDTIKMVILPRLMYLFQMLPIEIKDQQFIEWDKMISRYIWKGKRPRIRYKVMQLSKDKGGMALPTLKDYYYAAQIRPLVGLCDPQFRARWKEIEEGEHTEPPIQTKIADSKLTNNSDENPWLKISLKIWRKIAKNCSLEGAEKVLRWGAYDTDFIPNRTDSRFKIWRTTGVTAYCNLIKKGAVKSFEMCKKEYSLENRDFFRYLQIRHRLNGILAEGSGKLDNDILKVFITAYTSGGGRRIISKLYKGLQDSRHTNTHYVKSKWEREGRLHITEEEWENICKSQWRTTHSHSWREFGWKSIIRFFITPTQKRHQGVGTSCWRLCGSSEANHYHIFWDCPVLISFWQEIHKCLEMTFQETFPFNALALYLGTVTQHMQSAADQYLMRILLVGGKKALTRKWLQPDAPTVDDWYKTIHDIYVMERLTFAIKTQTDKGLRWWAKWVKYIGPLRPDLL